MNQVQKIKVVPDEKGIRLDKWFGIHFPTLSHSHLQKLLRTGQIRLDGHRVNASQRIEKNQEVRIPPFLQNLPPVTQNRQQVLSEKEQENVQSWVIFKNNDVLAINKPAGLAVQGGSKVMKHLDGMLDVLTFDAKERPKLVHRLDQETSGVLLLARNRPASVWLTTAFKKGEVSKKYMAVVAGCPEPTTGEIKAKLMKKDGQRGEQVYVDEDEGQKAVTHYTVIDHAGRKAALLQLVPKTGRTHQLRVHCAHMGHPILGDHKYGSRQLVQIAGKAIKGLCLHAYEISVTDPKGYAIKIRAPLSAEIKSVCHALGLSAPTSKTGD